MLDGMEGIIEEERGSHLVTRRIFCDKKTISMYSVY